jgi:phosphoglucosamine mutase
MSKYFGTDGIRGQANKELTATIAYRIGRFIGQYKRGEKPNEILIARDTRISGPLLLNGLVAGILSSGGNVTDLGVSTTPSVSYLTRTEGYDYGIMISASHNPYYDNGIKLFNRNGEKIEAEIEELLDKYIDSPEDYLPLAVNDEIGVYTTRPELRKKYIDKILDGTKITKNINLLIDTANGASSEIAHEVFSKLPVTYTIINDKPIGININARCGSTDLHALIEEIKKHKGEYQLGVAFDGDADRVLLVNKDGKELDGDYIIYALSRALQKLGKLRNNTVVVTVMSNLGLLQALDRLGINHVTVGVGDKYIQAKIKEEHYSLGGEQSGHIILGDYLNTGDGLITITHLLSLIEEAGFTLDNILDGFYKLPQKLVNVVVTNKEAVLKDHGLNELVKEVSDELEGKGRVLVRASGTEPKIRLMIEADSEETIDKYLPRLKEYVESIA